MGFELLHKLFRDNVVLLRGGQMPLGIIRAVHTGRFGVVRDEHGQEFDFGFGLIPEYRGERASDLKSFGPKGLRQDVIVYFETDETGAVTQVRPATDSDLIEHRKNSMDDRERDLYTKAVAVGDKDQVCPECRRVLLAFHHFINCSSETCPMAIRDHHGKPQNLFQLGLLR